MSSVLITDATILTVDAKNSVFAAGWLAFQGGRITGAGPKATQPDPASFDEVIDLPGHLVMPGLINAHTHSAMVLFRGRSEGQSLLTMDGWYNSIREPELSLIAADIGPAVALSCAEMAAVGHDHLLRPVFLCRGDRRRPPLTAACAPSSPTASCNWAIRRAARRRLAKAADLHRTAAIGRWPRHPLVRPACALCRQFRGPAAGRGGDGRQIRLSDCTCTWRRGPRTMTKRWRATV